MKVCPLSKNEPTMSFANCLQEQCGFWHKNKIRDGGECAILVLAENTDYIFQELHELTDIQKERP
jgi:hypothetical protein